METPSGPKSSEAGELLAFLQDYSQKLRNACTSYYERRKRSQIILYLTSISLFIAGLISVLLITNFVKPVEAEPQGSFARITILLSVVITFISVISFGVLSIFSYTSRNRLSEFEILPLQHALRNLVQRASQVETHSLLELDDRILFDLGLSDAESALAFSEWVLPLGSPGKSTEFFSGRKSEKQSY